jgi:hypothetical protein
MAAMIDSTDEKHDLNGSVHSATEAVPAELRELPAGTGKEKEDVLSQSAHQQPRDVVHRQDDLPAEPPSDEQVQMVQSAGEGYSVLTVTQKRLTVMAASLASLFSPMATAIYCQTHFLPFLRSRLTSTDPSLDTISKDLNVSNTKINITITLFLVCFLASSRIPVNTL